MHATVTRPENKEKNIFRKRVTVRNFLTVALFLYLCWLNILAFHVAINSENLNISCFQQMNPEHVSMLERHEAAVASDKIFTDLQDAINKIADLLHAWDARDKTLSEEDKQEKLLKIFTTTNAFCDQLVSVFPIYEHACNDFRYGEFMKISSGDLAIHPFKNFQTYMVDILRSLKPLFLGAKVITVLFQLPRKRFLSEYKQIRRDI